MGYIDDAAKQLLYQDQVTNLRNGLLGNGPTNSLNDPNDVESMKYFLKVKAVGGIFVASEQMESKSLDKKTDTYYANQDAHTKKVLDESSMIAPTELETGATQFTPANPGAKIKPPDDIQKKMLDFAKDEEATQKYFREHNVNATQNPIAYSPLQPEAGGEVPGHNMDIGKRMSNQLQFSVPDGKGGTQTYFKSWATKDGKPDQHTHGTPDEPWTDKLNAMIEEQRKATPGSYKFFIEKLHGKTVDGKFFKKNGITPGVTRDQIPNRMVFPAYIMNFNDSYSLGWSDYKFIGRGEKVWVYEETTRSLTLEFYMMSDFSADMLIKAIEDYQKLTVDPKKSSRESKLDATNGGNSKTAHTPLGNVMNPVGGSYDIDRQPLADEELFKELQRIRPDWGDGTTPNSSYIRGNKTGFVQSQYSGTPEQLWARYNFLAQCCYAWYRKDGKMKEQPFVRVRIGDFFDVVAKIDNLDFTTDDFDMDLNPSAIGAIPMGVRVAMRMTIIHEDEPTSEYGRFYHRRDYDGLNVSPYALPDNIQDTSKNMDSTLDKNESKSPISSISSLTDHGKSQTSFPNEVKGVQESLKSFGGSLKNLQGSASSFKDLSKGEKIKEALKNAKRLLDLSKEFDLQKIKDIKPKINSTPDPKSTSSLANTPIAQAFGTVAMQKAQEVPETKRSLFPQFKTPKTPPANP